MQGWLALGLAVGAGPVNGLNKAEGKKKGREAATRTLVRGRQGLQSQIIPGANRAVTYQLQFASTDRRMACIEVGHSSRLLPDNRTEP
jgi:hypothetical protein